jgi:hypothetical protein
MKMNVSSENLAMMLPLNLDLAGVFFHEALERFEAGSLSLSRLYEDLPQHGERVLRATSSESEDLREDAWVDVIQGVGGLEPAFGGAIREFAVGQILLVAAAEAYANAVAHHSLGGASAALFDKLSPTGKWLFLPDVLRIKWKPNLSRKPLQDFADLVVRRNQLIHPKQIRIRGVVGVEEFLKRIGADPKVASRDLECVRCMIREFNLNWNESYGPDWLDPENARQKPPCFFAGSIEFSLRLGTPGQKD